MWRAFEDSHRGFIAISGNEWRSFLQGLLTCDVMSCGAVNTIGYGYMLSVRSRIISDVFIYPEARDDGCVLSCDLSLRDKILKLLRMYKLRCAVELTTPEFVEISTPSRQDERGAKDPRHPELGYRYLCEIPQPTNTVDHLSFVNARLRLGILEGAEYGDEKVFPLECGAPYINALSLDKGCYIGQELVTRTYRTGEVRNFIIPGVVSDSSALIPPGVEVTFENRKVGKVLFHSGEICMMRLKYQDLPLSLETEVVVNDTHRINLIIPETLHAHINRSQ